MNTQHQAIAQVLNPEFIKRFTEIRYTPSHSQLYIFREQASHLSETVRSALSSVISGNVHAIFDQLDNKHVSVVQGERIDLISRRLDDILWNEIVSEKLKGHISPALYADIYKDHLDGTIIKRFGSPNEAGLALFVEVYSEAEVIMAELKDSLEQIKSHMKTPYIATGDKLNLNKGSFEDKTKTIAHAAVALTNAANHVKSYGDLYKDTPVVADLISVMQDLKESKNSSENQICPMVSVKIYSNNNVDVKIHGDSIKHLIEAID